MRGPLFERDDSLSRAHAIVRERICGLPEFAHARSLVVNAAVEQCRGKSVAQMRALGGFSDVLRAQVAALPEAYRLNHGSKLLPYTVADVLGQFIPSLRAELQTILQRLMRQKLDGLPAGAWLEPTDFGSPDSAATYPYAVWLDGDVLGVGQTEEEAIEDARATVKSWSDSAAKNG